MGNYQHQGVRCFLLLFPWKHKMYLFSRRLMGTHPVPNWDQRSRSHRIPQVCIEFLGGETSNTFFHVHPENWGRWIPFDLRIFFKWVETTNQHHIWICFRGLLLLSMSNPHKITICLEYGIIWNTLHKPNISPQKWHFEDDRWDMLVPWRVIVSFSNGLVQPPSTSEFGRELPEIYSLRRRRWCQGYLKSCGLVVWVESSLHILT